MKILLTGATGFLGSHILKGLLDSNYDVVIIKRKTSDIYRIKNLMHKIIAYNSDEVKLDEVFSNHKFDAIIHTATSYGRNNENTEDIIKTNILFPVQLMRLATLNHCSLFVNTDTFFGKKGNEDYQYLSSYTLSKKQILEWGKIFAKSEKLQFINMRLEHIYGEKDNPDKFIPMIVSKCLNNEKYIKLTPGKQKRDFIYVEDVVQFYLELLKQNNKFGSYEEFEVGTGESHSIKEMVEIIHKITNSTSVLEFGALNYRQGELMDSKAHENEINIKTHNLYDGVYRMIKNQ